MSKIKDLTGQVFNRITVLKFVETRGKSCHAYYSCVCICGKRLVIRGSHLKDNTTKSCGCFNKERSSTWLKKYANSKAHKGKGNPSWKGDKAKYNALHNWLLRYYTKRIHCDHCKKPKKLDWALKKGKKYSRNEKDYLNLCRSCHLKYDYTEERKRNVQLGRLKFIKDNK